MELSDRLPSASPEHLRKILDFAEINRLFNVDVSCTALTLRSYMLHVRTTPKSLFSSSTKEGGFTDDITGACHKLAAKQQLKHVPRT